MSAPFYGPERCGIVLAAGEGRRLRSFIRQLRGDDLPKQYVNFIGRRSMLEHTFHRAEQLIPAERIWTIINQRHLKYREVWRQLADRPNETVIVQPENKETGPGLLLPLLHLHRRHPEAVVVIFPSDHFILEEELFMGHIDLACRAVEREPAGLVLLGLEPHGPEPDYGYIVPDRRTEHGAASCVRRVIRFVEKPDRAAAQSLVHGGALWNTFVMVVRAKSLLGLVRRTAPALYRSFLRIREAIGTTRERTVVDEVYRTLTPVNFSKGILEQIQARHSTRLSVLPVRGVFWSDWGSERRLAADLQRTGYLSRFDGIRCRWPPSVELVRMEAEPA